MAKIKWTKDDVINAFEAAYEELGVGQPVKQTPVSNVMGILNARGRSNGLPIVGQRSSTNVPPAASRVPQNGLQGIAGGNKPQVIRGS